MNCVNFPSRSFARSPLSFVRVPSFIESPSAFMKLKSPAFASASAGASKNFAFFR